MKNINILENGFSALENFLPADDYVYVLRYVYNLLCDLRRKNIKKNEIIRYIEHFERMSLLPGFLSSLPVDQFLDELEDELYINAVLSGKDYFPTF